jgi:cleavage and polyadenylation specificity factor subunit 1
MQCYTELTAPTAVSHSVALSFLNLKATNLAVAKTSLLQIFELKSVATEVDSNSSEDVETSPQDIAADTLDRTFFSSDIALQKLETTSKLVLVAEYPLAGTVSALGRVKRSQYAKTPGDILLVAFREAKISLVGWDAERFCITTLSIHYYENSLPALPWAQDVSYYPSYVSIDPSNRCASLRFGARQLAIIPFRQDLDELADEEFDPDLDDPAERPKLDRKLTNGDATDADVTSYSASFVLSLTAIDRSLVFPVHLAFLHGYREPTFGVLSSIRAPSSSMALERRDILMFKVFTLDLEGKESTNILSVAGLPSDLTRVIALPSPVGGALLVGPNLLVHVDQSGKTSAVAVNEYARQLTSLGMMDESHLKLRLEDCAIEQLGDGGDMLIVTTTGQLALLSFQLDGAARLTVHLVTQEQGCYLVPTGVSSCTAVGRGRIFLGNEDNDSVLLGWTRKTAQLSKKRSLADMLGHEAAASDDDADDFDDDDDDDIYGEEPQLNKSMSRASIQEPVSPAHLTFRIHDRLPNFAPAGDMTIGKISSTKGKSSSDVNSLEAVEVVYPSGRGKEGGLVICGRDVNPRVSREAQLPNIKSAWAFHVSSAISKGLVPKGEQDSEAMLSADASYDQYVVASEAMTEGEDESFLYSVGSKGELKKIEDGFDPEGATVDIGVMSNGSRILQVKMSEVRCYNSGESICSFLIQSEYTSRAFLQPLQLFRIHLLLRMVISNGRFLTEYIIEYNSVHNTSCSPCLCALLE